MSVARLHSLLATPVDGAQGDAAARAPATSIAATRTTGFDVAAASSTGTRHASNEDCHSSLDAAEPLFVVADGVGGGALAARASRQLVEHLHAALHDRDPDAELVRAAIVEADRAIRRTIASRTDASGAATMALCVATDALLSHWLVAWVGDCRAYHVTAHERVVTLVTTDDTYRQLAETPPAGSSPDDPARMIGNGAVDQPNVDHVDVAPGEMLVLCSDGVHKHVGPADLAALLGAAEPLAERARRVIERARSGGSHDDATVLVIERSASA